jgi:hypothetical protein
MPPSSAALGDRCAYPMIDARTVRHAGPRTVTNPGRRAPHAKTA